MGQALGRAGGRPGPPGARAGAKEGEGGEGDDPFRDASRHSRCSAVSRASVRSRRSQVHPDPLDSDEASLEHAINQEDLVEGPGAALQAAREVMESGELGRLAGPEAAALQSVAYRDAQGAQRRLSSESPAGPKPPLPLPQQQQPPPQQGAKGTQHRLSTEAPPPPLPPLLLQPPGQAKGPGSRLARHVAQYFHRMQGGVEKPGKLPSLLDIALGWLGAFVSILAIAALAHWATPHSHLQFLVASFGASAVLVFAAAEGKLSQPRNLVGGHVVSALVGCVCRLIFRDVLWLSAALAVATAVSAMQLTKTTHPPGGATALIAASQPSLPIWAGFEIVVVVLINALIMLLVGLLVNNAQRHRRYPTYWF